MIITVILTLLEEKSIIGQIHGTLIVLFTKLPVAVLRMFGSSCVYFE
jgi:hypothetical protein